MVGWNRTEIIKNFLTDNREIYNRKTLRHEYFCIREEMNAFLKDKQDIDLDKIPEYERQIAFGMSKMSNYSLSIYFSLHSK